MKKTVAAIVMGLIVSSGSWAFDFNDCVIASKLYCAKNKCKQPPKLWCLKAANQTKAQKHNEKLASKVKAKTKTMQAKEIFNLEKTNKNQWKGKSSTEKL